jgi:hypothetical protein
MLLAKLRGHKVQSGKKRTQVDANGTVVNLVSHVV